MKRVTIPTKSPTKSKSQFDWQAIFSQSFLDVYQVDKVANVWLKCGYDFVFELPQATLVFLVRYEAMASTSLQVKKSTLATLQQRAVSQLIKRHQQLYRKNDLYNMVNQHDESHDIYYIGLTSLAVTHQQQAYDIQHEFGGRFFQEECVLDLDDKDKIIQVFSVHSLLKIMEMLQTPSDLLAFLPVHRQVLVQQKLFDNEIMLANQFLHSPLFFERAIKVQQRLIDIDLLDNIESRLLQVSSEQNAKALQTLLSSMQQFSRMWMKLVRGCVKRQTQAEATIPIKVLQLLVFTSMYTRMSIMEEVFAYSEHTIEQKREGYIRHQHSYNNFGRHYVIAIYGLDPKSHLSQTSIDKQYADVLLDVNGQLQEPVMSDLFLLGFDMTSQTATGDVEVKMDVYYQQGSTMTDAEKYLHQKLAQLKAENQALRIH